MKHNYHNLAIWSRSRILVTQIYKLTSTFPQNETYGLSKQLRRAAVSIPSNIAEGCGRKGVKELTQFLGIAVGSACEVETQLLIASDLKFIDASRIAPLVKELSEIRRMIIRFSERTKNKSNA